MNLNLDGKVALVTGGGRDVVGDISKLLAAEGAKVAVNYNSSAEEAGAVATAIAADGGEAKAFKADISDYDQVNRMADAVGGRSLRVGAHRALVQHRAGRRQLFASQAFQKPGHRGHPGAEDPLREREIVPRALRGDAGAPTSGAPRVRGRRAGDRGRWNDLSRTG